MDALLHVGLGNAVLATVLALAAWCAGLVCKRPALVHSLWLLVLLKLVTPPLVPLPILEAAPPDAREAEDALGAEVPDASELPNQVDVRLADGLPAGPGEHASDGAAIDRRSSSRPLPADPNVTDRGVVFASPAVTAVSWQGVLGAIWLAGCLAWWAVALHRIRRFRRIVREAVPAEPSLQQRVAILARRLGLARTPTVALVPASIPPLLWAAVGRAQILLPTALWTHCSREQQDALLAHELAHLRRRDHWVRLLELLAGGLYWWHPVVWWARHELREAEELCCDAWVVWALPAAAPAYAAAIVDTVSFLSRAPRTPLPASGVGHVYNLKRRLTMIVRGTPPRALSVAGFMGVVVLAAALLPLLPTRAKTADDEKAKNRPAVTKTEKPPKADGLPARKDPEKPTVARGASDDAVPNPKAGPRLAGDNVPADPNAAPQHKRAARGAGELASEPKAVPAKTRAGRLEEAQDEVELLEVQLDAKQAEVVEAEAELKHSKSMADRVKKLSATGAITAEEVETATNKLQIAMARLRGKQAVMAEAAIRLKHARRRLTGLQPRPKVKDPREAEPVNKSRRLEDLEKKLDALEKALESIRREIRPKRSDTNRAK